MILKTELLMRRMTPERAADVLNTHNAVDDYLSKYDRHTVGLSFAERIWPLLQRYNADEDSVNNEEVLAVCNQEKDVYRESALVFCEMAFHTTFEGVREEAREKKVFKAWRFREMANYLNEHADGIDYRLLDWAYFVWHTEFAGTLDLSDDVIDDLIENINADKIKDTRHNREYYGYDGDMLDLPDWLAYLTIYLEDRLRYDKLNEIVERLKYGPLQNALAYRFHYHETFVELSKIRGAAARELNLIMLSQWYRHVVQEGATLRSYYQLDSNHPLSTIGQRTFEKWEGGIKDLLQNTFGYFFGSLGRNEVEKWYYTEHRYGGLPNTDVEESEKEIRQIVNDFLADTFSPGDAMANFANADYLVFLGDQCERLRNNTLADTLWSGYNYYLHSKELYRLPEFGDGLMELLRGFTLPMRLRKSHMADYKQLLELYFTRHEGLGCKISDDYNNMVAREVFVMSGLLLMTEDDDLIESERRTIFADVLDILFRQIASCWMEHLQERYIEALKVAYALVCQIWQKEREGFETRLAQSSANLYWVATVLSVGDGKMYEKTGMLLKQRWDNEHLVMYVRAQQTHQMNRYNALKKWIEGVIIEQS